MASLLPFKGFARRFLLFQLAWILSLTNFQSENSASFFAMAEHPSIPSGYNGQSQAGSFNHEIEKRVHERVSELMNVPVTMLGLIEQYSMTDVFEPPFLRPHQTDEIFRFMWTVWKQFNVDLYYGQEDGLFLGVIKGSGTYQEGRGSNGYYLEDKTDNTAIEVSEEDAYFRRLYYDKCLDRENGAPQKCTLQPNEDYVSCVDNCKLAPCPSSLPTATTRNSLVSTEYVVDTPEHPTILCPTYDIMQVPDNNEITMGYIPRYYYCLNDAGKFIENDPPGSVASPSSMTNGICTHSDGVTLVDGKTSTKETYAIADRRNYLFLGDYHNQYPTEEEASAAATALYLDDPTLIDESQKSDQIFVGGHHSRRYEPRLRPWYIGTREVQNAFWTKPYPFATNNDMGISYGKPIYYTDPSTGHKVFRGVICVDYDLEEISRFLREVFMDLGIAQDKDTSDPSVYTSSSGATVLIVEDDAPHYIIGSSTGSKAAKKVRIDDETINCEDEEIFSGEVECKTVRATPQDYAKDTRKPMDRVMAFAFEAQKEAGFPNELVVSKNPNENDNGSEFFVSQSLTYEQSEGENLKWRIIVAMPVSVASNDELLLGDPMFVVVFAVGVTGCVACLVLLYYYFQRRGSTEVRMSDWRFTSVFILGCAILNLTTLTYFGPASNELCMLRMWTFHFFFVATISPLLVKVWRIYKLVGSADRAVRLSITNRKAFLYTMPAILLQVLILTMFSIFDPSKEYTYVEVGTSSIFQHSICKHDTVAFSVTQLVLEGSMVLSGCVLAWKTRNLGSALGEAKQLLFAMYNVALVALIVLLMGTLLTIDQKSVYVIMTVGIFWSTVFSSCAFVLPRLLQIQRNGMRRRNSSHGRSSSYYHKNNTTGNLSSSFQTRRSAPVDTASSASFVAGGGSMYVEPRSKIVSSSSLHSSDYNVELKASQSEPWTLSNEVSRDTIDGHSSFSGSIGELCESDQDVDPHGSDSDEKETTESQRTSFTKVPSGKSIDSFPVQNGDIEASIVFE